MKIFGLHWIGHATYLALLAGLVFRGETRLSALNALKDELGEAQGLALPEVSMSNAGTLNKIKASCLAYPMPRHLEINEAARHAFTLVDNFGRKAGEIRQRMRAGTPPQAIDWSGDLVNHFYRLADSLSIFYGGDSTRRAWFEECLFAGRRTFLSDQLPVILAGADTAEASRFCRNLQLRAELALAPVLKGLQKQMRSGSIVLDRVLPVLSYSGAPCPRAGEPFEADISIAGYWQRSQNVSLKINGKPFPLEAGVAHYSAVFKQPGNHRIPVEISAYNPLTGEIRSYRKDFLASVPDTVAMR